MSQRQLALVFSNSKKNLKIEEIRSPKSKTRRANFSGSPFQEKIGRLEREHPAAAEVIEKLVDDIFADTSSEVAGG